MASVWIRTRPTKDGGRRYRVEYRIKGRESVFHYGGSFKTQKLALARKAWIVGELAAQRIPDLRLLEPEATAQTAPTLAAAADAWRATRVDVEEQTRRMHASDLARIFKIAPKRATAGGQPTRVAGTGTASGRYRSSEPARSHRLAASRAARRS